LNEIDAKVKYMALVHSSPNYGDNRYVVKTRQGQEYLGVNYLAVTRVAADKRVFKKWTYDQIVCALSDNNYLTLTIAGEGQIVLHTQEASEIASLITDYKAAEELKKKQSKDTECSIQ
jgi:hypothetical protein